MPIIFNAYIKYLYFYIVSSFLPNSYKLLQVELLYDLFIVIFFILLFPAGFYRLYADQR